MSKWSKMTDTLLAKEQDRLMDRRDKLEDADPVANKDKIDDFNLKIMKIDSEIESRQSAKVNVQSTTSTTPYYKYQMACTYINTLLRSVTNIAIQAGDGQFLIDFLLNQLQVRLCPQYQTTLVNFKMTNKVNSIDDFKKFLREHFDSKKSIFLCLEQIDGIEKGSTESYRDLASKVEQQLFDITTVVEAKWKAASDANKSQEMSASDVFSLIGGMQVLRIMRKDTDLDNHCITRIDTALDASGIANIAMSYIERKQSTDPVMSNIPAVNWTNQQNSKPQICFDFQKGRCTRNPCQYRHEKIENFNRNRSGGYQRNENHQGGRVGQGYQGRGGQGYRGRGGKNKRGHGGYNRGRQDQGQPSANMVEHDQPDDFYAPLHPAAAEGFQQ